MYGKKGFTNKIVEVLPKPEHGFGNYLRYTIKTAQLLTLQEELPRKNLGDRQNGSPRVKAFIDFAKKSPESQFEMYIITDKRTDERLSIDGVIFPKTDLKLAEEILMNDALDNPSDDMDIGDNKRWWWD